ncbi:MAG: hypothetical protein ACP5L1_04210 [Caldivirga sp.]|uniref:hypothetical protein n=1 Tax=Caldivirga sp. TaxID=2080243 RepID=UPI003D0D230F
MNSTRRVRHMDSGAVSVLATTYVLSLISLIMLNVSFNPLKATLVFMLMLFNALSLTKVHLRLISRPRPLDYALLIINLLPYSYLLYIKYGLLGVTPSIGLLLIFVIETLRGKGRGAVANVAGTVLMASVYLPWYIMMGGSLHPVVFYIDIVWLTYHAFSSTYVEGKLPFRLIKPWVSSLVWFTSLVLVTYVVIGYLDTSVYYFIPLIEPTIRAIHALWEDKLNPNEVRLRIRRIGWGGLAESLLLLLLLVLILLQLKALLPLG